MRYLGQRPSTLHTISMIHMSCGRIHSIIVVLIASLFTHMFHQIMQHANLESHLRKRLKKRVSLTYMYIMPIDVMNTVHASSFIGLVWSQSILPTPLSYFTNVLQFYDYPKVIEAAFKYKGKFYSIKCQSHIYAKPIFRHPFLADVLALNDVFLISNTKMFHMTTMFHMFTI